MRRAVQTRGVEEGPTISRTFSTKRRSGDNRREEKPSVRPFRQAACRALGALVA
jgi:hypothetical protein